MKIFLFEHLKHLTFTIFANLIISINITVELTVFPPAPAFRQYRLHQERVLMVQDPRVLRTRGPTDRALRRV